MIPDLTAKDATMDAMRPLSGPDSPGQLSLFPDLPAPVSFTRPGSWPAATWQRLLDDAELRERYAAKVWTPPPLPADRRHDGAHDRVCWYWLGAISSTGHGKLKVGPLLPGAVITAHVYGWHQASGLLEAVPGVDPVISHRCDEPSCQNPAHWRVVDRAHNNVEYQQRHGDPRGPLADSRGSYGRAAAIRQAILRARSTSGDELTAARAAAAAGLAGVTALFDDQEYGPVTSSHDNAGRDTLVGSGQQAVDYMRPPEICLYCDVRLTAADAADDAGVWTHAGATPCRRAVACDPDERDLRWQDWLHSPPLARRAGRGGAAHYRAYGSGDSALCGVQVSVTVPDHSQMNTCRACRNWRSGLLYAWRWEHQPALWRSPYTGSHIAPLVQRLGLRPASTGQDS